MINPVYYNNEGIDNINKFIEASKPTKIIFLVDENTHEHCLPKVISEIITSAPIEILEIESGEENKNIDTCVNLWEALTDLYVDRKSLIINIGGGVLTDMGGFVANTFKRGIKFINIPTTLLSMVDASVGGKTGIDLGSHKNQIGNFALPEMVFIDSDFLETLPESQILSGFSEIIKHGLIADENYWKEILSLRELNNENLKNLIERSVQIKSEVVAEDFTESGLRKILNFGHTIGHAIESFFLENGNTILHGEGVAAGMIMESYISMKKNMLPENEYEIIVNYISALFPKLKFDEENFSEILTFMQNDKKNSDNNLKFVLLKKIGKAVFDISVERELVEESMIYYLNK